MTALLEGRKGPTHAAPRPGPGNATNPCPEPLDDHVAALVNEIIVDPPVVWVGRDRQADLIDGHDLAQRLVASGAQGLLVITDADSCARSRASQYPMRPIADVA